MSRDDSTQNKGDDDTQKQCYDSQTEVETTCASLSGVCIFANVCAQPGIASRAALAVQCRRPQPLAVLPILARQGKNGEREASEVLRRPSDALVTIKRDSSCVVYRRCTCFMTSECNGRYT